MAITAATQRILDKALDGEQMTRAEALYLMALPLHTDDCYRLMSAANQLFNDDGKLSLCSIS